VIDQVCLVPDVPTFFEAIAAWDQRHFFPILIDEPAWTLPFLRAFRPARVVRYAGRSDRPARPAATPRSPADRQALWQAALEAVARAWSLPLPSRPDAARAADGAGAPPRWLGATPPGLVLTASESPMLAGAVALAAGRFQPLVRLELGSWSPGAPGDAGRTPRYADILTRAQAWRFARRVEARVAELAPRYDRLGDDCDFLTIAGDWPYRYADEGERGPGRGPLALDDLLGRALDAQPGAGGWNGARRRWAYAGRLLGDPAASVARAMGSLFLRPAAALWWDTYGTKRPWSDYALAPAADRLELSSTGPGVSFHRAGARADLVSWHRFLDPSHRFGFIWLNSSGGPQSFTIPGGPGRPADLPRGFPAALVMIHSFSAADPADPRTLAGRWLAQGAFAYFGSVHEPFLLAFRSPRLVAELVAAEVPLVAALRQGEFEAFGHPWRLIYLGDPLYRLPVASGTTAAARAGPATQRLGAGDWQAIAPEYAAWPVVEIAPIELSPDPVAGGTAAGSDDALLIWSRDAAIRALTARRRSDDRRTAPGRPTDGPGPPAADPGRSDHLSALRRIRRDRLDPPLRPIFDDLLIDALSEIGAFDELQARLARIPPAQCGPRVWQALETGAAARLARLVQDPEAARGYARALDLWDEVIRLAWPAGWEFPAQFTERVAAMAQADSPRRLASWRDRLRRAQDDLGAKPGPSRHLAAIAAERTRVEARLGRDR
jgi:hypothetical protein